MTRKRERKNLFIQKYANITVFRYRFATTITSQLTFILIQFFPFISTKIEFHFAACDFKFPYLNFVLGLSYLQYKNQTFLFYFKFKLQSNRQK